MEPDKFSLSSGQTPSTPDNSPSQLSSDDRGHHFLSATLVEIQHHLLLSENPDRLYTELLPLLGKFSGATRVAFWENCSNEPEKRCEERADVPHRRCAEWRPAKERAPRQSGMRLQAYLSIDGNDDGNTVEPEPNYDWSSPLLARWYRLLQQRKTIWGQQQDFPDRECSFLQSQRILSILILPLIVKGEFFGLLSFDYSQQEHIWESSEVVLLESLAMSICLVHERLLTQAQLQKLNQKLENKVQQRTAELKAAKEQFEAVLDTVPASISWISSDLHYLGVNKQLAVMVNLPREEFIGKPVGELNSHQEFMLYLQQFFESQVEKSSAEFTVKGSDDRHNYFFVVAKKYHQGSDAVLVGVDITDRHLAEDALRNSERRFRAIFEQAAVGIVELDLSGQFLKVNQKFCELFGYREDELLGENFLQIIAPEARCEMPEYFSQFASEKVTSLSEERCCLTKANEEVWINLTISSIHTENQNSNYLIVIVEDITVRKQAEADIRNALKKEKELNELKSNFITMTSHEFRTPLATIFGSTELLEYYSDRLSGEKKQKYLNRIYENVQHMTNMLDDILLIGRSESGQLYFSPQPLNLVSFCDDLIQELTIGNHHLNTISSEFDLGAQRSAENAIYLLDEKLLRHILNNLLSNALKYSPPETQVTLHVTDDSTELILEVVDRGIGIPPQEQKHLFSSFYRCHNVGKIAGTGLGLSIVKKAVEVHGGNIKLESQLDVGTKVTVKLPIISTATHQ